MAGADTAFINIPVNIKEDCSLIDVQVSSTLLRRCFSNAYDVKICNNGTIPSTDIVAEITLDSFFIYQSSTAPLISQNGNIYNFSVGDIGINECKSFKIHIEVSCDAELGQEHCVQVHVPTTPCLISLPVADDMECQPNIGSFDPNDKTAFLNGHFENEWVKSNTDIDYKIRFQNTGTDTAFTVVIEDQLSTLLDPASVPVQAAILMNLN